jgi:dTDP-4-dehydro-6-deoxy-alpha-D-glucopyranose 2,3-dehydratase
LKLKKSFAMMNSLLTTENCFNSTEELFQWIQQRNQRVVVEVQRIPFLDLKGWFLDNGGNLRHKSGKFFSIQGIHVKTDFGLVSSWDQPVINQPEIGFLGILTKEINGVLYFLMQAKIEPGNVNCVQISPTLQATKSNYSRVHKGKKPAYLDYFLNAKPNQILLDQLQSEQGARFLRKRNRNIIIKVDENIEVLEDFRWMTLGQIKEMIHHDNMVNMDTRTVISGIEFSHYITPLINKDQMSVFGKDMLRSSTLEYGLYSMREHLSWLSNLKSKYDLYISEKSIKELEEWKLTDDEIVRDDKKYFRVIGVNVTISNREVSSWCQPLVEPMQQGLCAFIIKKIGNVYHFLVQAKLECGNFDIIELAPTIQCLTGNVFKSMKKPPFTEYALNASNESIIYDVMQSEEGGRFYREQNRNMIIKAGDDFPEDVPANYTWMTLNQLYDFLRFNNYLNIQARSLLSAIKYI